MPASWLRRRRLGRLDVSVVGGLVFFGRNVVELAVQPAVVELMRVILSSGDVRMRWCRGG